MSAQTTEFLDTNPDAVNLPIFGLFMLIGIAITVWGIYLLFLCIKKLTEGKTLTALIVTIVTLIIMGVIPL